MQFPSWEVGATNRAESISFQAGGKGVNVSRMLARLGSTNTAIIFPGGHNGAACEQWLGDRRVPFVSFAASSETRPGAVVRDSTGNETTFLGPNSRLNAEALDACAEFLKQVSDSSVLVVCGSIPHWNEAHHDATRNMLIRWMEAGRVLIADTYGDGLRWCAKHPIELIKVNRKEFEGLYPENHGGLDFEKKLRQMHQTSPVRNWIVTNGPNPVYLVDNLGTVTIQQPPQVREISATGSGDVLLAACLHARYTMGKPWKEALAFALPYASANAASSGIADFSIDVL